MLVVVPGTDFIATTGEADRDKYKFTEYRAVFCCMGSNT